MAKPHDDSWSATKMLGDHERRRAALRFSTCKVHKWTRVSPEGREAEQPLQKMEAWAVVLSLPHKGAWAKHLTSQDLSVFTCKGGDMSSFPKCCCHNEMRSRMKSI